MAMFLTVVLVGCLAFAVMMLIRNKWVFHQHERMADYCFDRPPMQWAALGRPDPDWFLPSYGTMLARFWIWKLEPFLLRPMDLDERAHDMDAA